MKDKDHSFYEACDLLESLNVNLAAAAHWQDHELLALPGFTRRLLSGWRSYFFAKKAGTIEMGAPRDVWRPHWHARVLRILPNRGWRHARLSR